MIHIRNNYFLECQQAIVGLGELLERIGVEIRRLKRNNKDRVLLKD